jgi:hypothetical protein
MKQESSILDCPRGLWRKTGLPSVILTFSFFLFPFSFSAQTPPPTRGVIRLKVKYKGKELPRKRFFLVKGSLAENKNLIDQLKAIPPGSRECFYRERGASEALIKWLKENDCDSVYCREIDEKFLHGNDAVPEFQAAYKQGVSELKTPELGRRWLTVNLAPEIRDGFYLEKQRLITNLIAQAEAGTSTKVLSVMTDQKGTAYLTDIDPGTYTISNLISSEVEGSSILWACEKEIKPVNLVTAMRRYLTLSNEKDPAVKCEIIERPLPVCAKTVK